MTVAQLAALRERTLAMVDQLAALVGIESPSNDVNACTECAATIADLGEAVLGVPPSATVEAGRPFLRWSFGGPTRVLLVGHLDTVWPKGTLNRWPFSVVDGRATGPGAFDMKAGIVQLFHALATLDDLDGVTVVLNSDEEIGSGASRAAIEAAAAGAHAALVLEPSIDGALKTARKGVSMYELEITGRAAHAGLEPEKGANAAVELAHQILALQPIARPEVGTTVTPTVLTGGSTTNTVPAAAALHIDVRATTVDEQCRVDQELHDLQSVVVGCELRVLGGPNRPPLEPSASADLFARAQTIAGELGLSSLRGVAVGGGSDGNFTAGLGVPTLDGLGAVGDHAHGEGEYVEIVAMAERAALVAALVRQVLDTGHSG